MRRTLDAALATLVIGMVVLSACGSNKKKKTAPTQRYSAKLVKHKFYSDLAWAYDIVVDVKPHLPSVWLIVKVDDDAPITLTPSGLKGHDAATQKKRTKGYADSGRWPFVLRTRYMPPGKHKLDISVEAANGPAPHLPLVITKPIGLQVDNSARMRKLVVKADNKKFEGTITGGIDCFTVKGEAGTVVSFAGSKLTLPADNPCMLIDVEKRMRKAGGPLWLNLRLPLVVTFKGGQQGKRTLQIPIWLINRWLADKLSAVKRGHGVRFGAADKAPPKPRAIAVITSGAISTIGHAKDWTQLDLVAFDTEHKRTRSCGRYRSRRTGRVTTIVNRGYDHIYTIYNRRTGKRVAHKVVRAKIPPCHHKTRDARGDVGIVDNKAGTAYLKAYLEHAG